MFQPSEGTEAQLDVFYGLRTYLDLGVVFGLIRAVEHFAQHLTETVYLKKWQNCHS